MAFPATSSSTLKYRLASFRLRRRSTHNTSGSVTVDVYVVGESVRIVESYSDEPKRAVDFTLTNPQGLGAEAHYPEITQVSRTVHERLLENLVQSSNEVVTPPSGEADIQSLKQRRQAEQIKALLASWDSQPDDTPEEWWDEFDTFLREHRLDLR